MAAREQNRLQASNRFNRWRPARVVVGPWAGAKPSKIAEGVLVQSHHFGELFLAQALFPSRPFELSQKRPNAGVVHGWTINHTGM